MIFFSALGWLPLGDRLNMESIPPPSVTGLLLPDALTAGDLPLAGEILRHLAMPALVPSLPLAGLLTRTTRAATIETLGKDFVRHARAKGVFPAPRSRSRHLHSICLEIGFGTGSILTGRRGGD